MGLTHMRQKGSILIWVILLTGMIASISLHLWQVIQTEMKIRNNHNTYLQKQRQLEGMINERERQIYQSPHPLDSTKYQTLSFIPDSLAFGEPSGVELIALTVHDDEFQEHLSIIIHERVRFR